MKTHRFKKFLKDTSIINKPRTHPSPDKFSTNRNFPQNLTYKLNATKRPTNILDPSTTSFYENTKKTELTIRIAIRTWQARSISKTPTLTILPDNPCPSRTLQGSPFSYRVYATGGAYGHVKKPETLSRSTTNENWRG